MSLPSGSPIQSEVEVASPPSYKPNLDRSYTVSKPGYEADPRKDDRSPKVEPRYKTPPLETISPLTEPPFIVGHRFGYTMPDTALKNGSNNRKINMYNTGYMRNGPFVSNVYNVAYSYSGVSFSTNSGLSLSTVGNFSSLSPGFGITPLNNTSSLDTLRGTNRFVAYKRRKPVGLEKQVFDLINQFRSKNRVNMLEFSRMLSDLEGIHNQKMANGECSLSCQGLKERVKYIDGLAGYAEVVGTCLDCKNPAEKLVNTWIDSPQHRKKLLGNYNSVGISIEKGKRDWFGSVFFALM